jgi:hypothetical protein
MFWQYLYTSSEDLNSLRVHRLRDNTSYWAFQIQNTLNSVHRIKYLREMSLKISLLTQEDKKRTSTRKASFWTANGIEPHKHKGVIKPLSSSAYPVIRRDPVTLSVVLRIHPDIVISIRIDPLEWLHEPITLVARVVGDEVQDEFYTCMTWQRNCYLPEPLGF